MSNFWTVPEIWPGATVYIVGGGPSIATTDLSPLLEPSRRVIGVNNAYLLGDWVDVCWWGDCNWPREIVAGRTHKDRLRDWGGLRITCCTSSERANWVKVVGRAPKRDGLTKDRRLVCWNMNSGASAINLAVHFGAKRIVLVGFDMHVGENDRHNYHAAHTRNPPQPDIYEKRFIPPFKAIKRDLDGWGIECVNATPGSSLDVFPIMTLQEAFECDR